jgi:two-component system OmpR family sensor kinase
MSLTGRFSTLFLSVLALVLVGFSTALYVSARIYLDRQLGDRLTSALAILAAAAEIHPDGVEWEPQERVLPLGQESGPERLRWMVYDDQGRRIDHSRNVVDVDFTDALTSHPGTAELPARLVDRQGGVWRVARRRIRPEAATATGSRAAADRQEWTDAHASEVLHPSLVLTAWASLDPIEATLATLGWFLVALSLGTWLIAALLCRRLSRRALTPLTRLVASARGLDASDAGWCLDEAGTGDELDELGCTFNELLARLHVAYERQRRFSGDASHQLRTPLTVLIGQIEVALRQERSGEEYRRTLGSALGRAVQLGRIVEALMFLGRAEADAQLPECELLDLDRWVAEHLAERSAMDPASEVVHTALQGDGAWVRAHAPLLGQLLDNLLDNARKHGRPGTPIRVETIREGDAVVLAVEDAGPGIPPEDIPHIFEPFYRSALARRRGTSGVGLGLAVAHRIAVAFGGSLDVRSEQGNGARFEVRLKATPPPLESSDDCDGNALLVGRSQSSPSL